MYAVFFSRRLCNGVMVSAVGQKPDKAAATTLGQIHNLSGGRYISNSSIFSADNAYPICARCVDIDDTPNIPVTLTGANSPLLS